ncbi:MAG: TetR/AcrR family transcriptional regulator [Proteobacteria bacterium]|nr:TetR/AcrR family transcriptional regulator [Pseudomonadota bacterium]
MGLEERKKKEKEQRRKTILKAARKQFFEKGFNPVTVASIARKAELSKGTIYLYFKSKEEIYAQILLSDIDKFHERISSVFQEGKGASEMLLDFSDIYIDYFLADRELFRILMVFMLRNDSMDFSEELNNDLIRATNSTIDVIERIFRYGIDEGEFPPDINIRQGRNAIWGLLNGVISLHLFTGKESARERKIRSAVKVGLEGFIKGLTNVYVTDKKGFFEQM